VKILFIAPLPPPVHGQSVVSRALLDDLARDNEMLVVDFSKPSMAMGAESPRRFVEVLSVLRQVGMKQLSAERIYLTISESLLGNVKDLVIYALCFRKLSKMSIHLHGGSIKRITWDRWPLLFRLNRPFIRRLGNVILSGPSHLTIFDGLIARERVHIVPNFAPEYLFVEEAEIRNKFRQTTPLRILYISNFILEKGYADLLDAFLSLDDSHRSRVQIDFAGRFDNVRDERTFLDRIAGHEQLCYHGLVDDEAKRRLFLAAHAFCLPTAMFEGQPISILEAYAAGCVVVTTGQTGILDVFTDGINGFEVEPSQPSSIAAAISRMCEPTAPLTEIAVSNNRLAREQYRAATYTAALREIMLPQ
jgi:glycosyltransferase involved in cell wall biosynthesis